MGHAIHRIEHFEIVAPYTLALRFDDGTHQRIDFRPVLEGEVFAPLQDLKLFNAVELDPTFGTIQWPNGADFDPETLTLPPTALLTEMIVSDCPLSLAGPVLSLPVRLL